MTPRHVVVIGAGITGLTVAYWLQHHARARGQALQVTVLESGRSVGGHVQTVRDDGFVVEAGPNGFLDREPSMTALVQALGLEPRLIEARPEAARRFIVRGGRLCLVPQSPASLLRTPALSLRGRLRMLYEPFAKGPTAGVEETVFEFARRRIGEEAADVFVDTAVAGISGGDSRRLSAGAQFPMMLEMEREHGSLMKAMIARRRRGVRSPTLRTFDGGMGVITGRLAETLGNSVRTGVEVTGITRDGGDWQISTGAGPSFTASHVVLATSALRASLMTRDVDPELSSALGTIPVSPVTVVGLAYRSSDIPRDLDGYGYLVTRGEGLLTLGVLWESSLFAGRAPEGMVLLRVMMGGARSPQVSTLDGQAATRVALAELQTVFGVTAAPTRVWTFPAAGAISQYTIGHLDRVAAIRRLAARHTGLDLCGTSYDGVSFTSAVASASSLVEALLTRAVAA